MREDGQRLGHREARADADPRAAAERQILEAVAVALALGAKRSMSNASGSSHSRAWRCSSHGQIETRSPGSTSCSPSRSAAIACAVEARHRRIEPQRFLEDQRAAAAAGRAARRRSPPASAARASAASSLLQLGLLGEQVQRPGRSRWRWSRARRGRRSRHCRPRARSPRRPGSARAARRIMSVRKSSGASPAKPLARRARPAFGGG